MKFINLVRNIKSFPVYIAYKILAREINKDPDYKHSWRANISMVLLDNSDRLTPREANLLGSKVVDHLFSVKRSN